MDLELSRSGGDPPEQDTTLHASGFLDLSTCEALIETGLHVLWDGAGLELDLSQVHFIDASGVAALTALSNAAEREGKPFLIVAASFPVRRLLQILDLADEWIAPRRPRTETV